MFESNDLIIYQSEGVCRVLGMEELDMMRDGRKKSYYVLSPLKNPNSKIYSPMDNSKLSLRKIMTPDEVTKLLKEIPECELLWIDNEKQRESVYKSAVKSTECKEWIRIIRTVYQRKKNRIASGKKMTATDERYFKIAKALLYEELAVVLGKEESEMEEYLIRYLSDEASK